MFARNAKMAVLLLSAAVVSCSQEDAFSGLGIDGEEITTTISVQAPDVIGSRAVPDIYQSDYDFGTEADIHSPAVTQYLGTSGMPSIGNVDLGDDVHAGHPLSYTVAIYVQKTAASGETDPTYTLVEQQSQVDVHASEAYFNFRLIKGQTYRIVAYADFSGAAKTDLENIAVTPTEALNDELADAFFVSQDFVADEFLGAVLKRPFAKLRLVAHDLDRFAVAEKYKITKVEVKYTKQRMLAVTNFNALTGDFNYNPDASAADYTVKSRPVSYAQEYNADNTVIDKGAAIFTMYLPANFGTPTEADLTHGTPINDEVEIPQSWMYPFDVTVSYVNEKGEESKIERSYQFDIPVKRNWLTTVDVKDFWSDITTATVSINPEFEGFIGAAPNTYKVDTQAKLRNAVNAIAKSTEKAGKIVLDADIELTGQYGIEIGSYYKSEYEGQNSFKLYAGDPITVHIDLNGHKLSGTPEGVHYSGALIALYGPHTLIIDDTSKSGSGEIASLPGSTSYVPAIISWRYGSNIIINGGKILSSSGQEVIYLYDPLPHMGGYLYGEDYRDANGKAYLNGKPSTLTINGGWFESVGAVYTDDKQRAVINLYNGGTGGWPTYPRTTESSKNAMGYGTVHINGGSFVEFDPAKGDNISGLYAVDPVTHQHVEREWVDSSKYNVVTSTVNGQTVYTVVHKDYNGETPETWNTAGSLGN